MNRTINRNGTQINASSMRWMYSLSIALLVSFILTIPSEASGQGLLRVKDVRFEGNVSISSGDLKKQMNLMTANYRVFRWNGSEFNQRILKLDRAAIERYCKSKGFINCTVRDSFEVIDRKDVILHFFINEGEKFSIKEINIRGNDLIADTEILRILDSKPGKPINPYLLRKDLVAIRTEYQKRGKPFVELENRLTGEKEATVVIDIREGDTVFIDSILVEGTSKVKENIVFRELLLKPRQKYNLENIQMSQRRVFETGLFSNVVIDHFRTDTINKTLNIKVRVREREMRLLGVNIGFAQVRPVSGTGDPITYLNFSGEWGHRNLFRSGRSLRLKGTTSIGSADLRSRQSRVEVSYTEPWILGFRAPTTVRTYIENEKVELVDREVDLSTYGFDVGVFKKFSEEFTARLTQGLRIIRTGGTSLDTLDITEEDRQRAVGLFIINDGRKNIFYPVNSSALSIEAKFAGGPFGGNSDLYRMEASWSRYQPFPLKGNWTMAFRVKGGYVRSFGETTQVPLYDRFWLGGNSSIRGYKERDLKRAHIDLGVRAITKVIANLELRFPLLWRFGGELFVDSGNLWGNNEDASLSDIRYSTGAGLTFATPLGPARIDYGYKINPEAGDTGSRTRFHFGLLYAF